MMKLRTTPLILIGTLLASTALLGACNRAGEGSTPASTSNQTSGAKDARTDRDTGTAAPNVARDAGQTAGQKVDNAADAVANTTRDAAITTTINAKLAADERLSALNINVDTAGGRVVLRGTAPDTASRTRATELARTVDGVTNVANELSVQPRQ